MKIPKERMGKIIAFAAEPGTTFHGVRRMVEIALEDLDRAAKSGIALDAAAPITRFEDREARAIADRIWDAVHGNPLKHFIGKTYQDGMRSYLAARPLANKERRV